MFIGQTAFYDVSSWQKHGSPSDSLAKTIYMDRKTGSDFNCTDNFAKLILRPHTRQYGRL